MSYRKARCVALDPGQSVAAHVEGRRSTPEWLDPTNWGSLLSAPAARGKADQTDRNEQAQIILIKWLGMAAETAKDRCSVTNAKGVTLQICRSRSS